MEYEYDRSAGVYRTHHDFDDDGASSATVAVLLHEITGADGITDTSDFDSKGTR